MKNKLGAFLIITLFCVIILLFNNYYALGVLYFYVLIFYLGIDVIKKKNIELIHVWNASFLFIIIAEVFIFPEYNKYALEALKFLTIANNLVCLGYLTSKSTISYKVTKLSKKKINKNTFRYLFKGLIVVYIFFQAKSVMNSISLGRINAMDDSTEVGGLYMQFIAALGLILPAIIAYYYAYLVPSKILKPFFWSLPIFIILFLGGTRFPLLFSFLGFLLVLLSKQKKLTIKNYLFITGAIILLNVAASTMRGFRAVGFGNTFTFIEEKKPFIDIPTFVSEKMSPEGVIRMTGLMIKHFEKNDYLYGKSTSFILYFWMPRSLWEDKPTMLGHWFIRKYEDGFSSGHSASFGFTGDFFADFGYLSLILVFFLGILLKRLNNYKNATFLQGGYNIVLGSMIFPWVFFFVRSPITSTMTFIGVIVIYKLFKKIVY